MLVSNGVLLHRFGELVHEGMRTGRHLELDARSLAYRIEGGMRDDDPDDPNKKTGGRSPNGDPRRLDDDDDDEGGGR